MPQPCHSNQSGTQTAVILTNRLGSKEVGSRVWEAKHHENRLQPGNSTGSVAKIDQQSSANVCRAKSASVQATDQLVAQCSTVFVAADQVQVAGVTDHLVVSGQLTTVVNSDDAELTNPGAAESKAEAGAHVAEQVAAGSPNINTAAQQLRENVATGDQYSTSTDFQPGNERITVLGSAETVEVNDGTAASVVCRNVAVLSNITMLGVQPCISTEVQPGNEIFADLDAETSAGLDTIISAVVLPLAADSKVETAEEIDYNSIDDVGECEADNAATTEQGNQFTATGDSFAAVEQCAERAVATGHSVTVVVMGVEGARTEADPVDYAAVDECAGNVAAVGHIVPADKPAANEECVEIAVTDTVPADTTPAKEGSGSQCTGCCDDEYTAPDEDQLGGEGQAENTTPGSARRGTSNSAAGFSTPGKSFHIIKSNTPSSWADEVEEVERQEKERSITMEKQAVVDQHKNVTTRGQANKFHTVLPIDFDPEFHVKDNEAEVMTWSKLIEGEVKIVARRSVSPVGRSSGKLKKLRSRVDFIEHDAGKTKMRNREEYL